MERIFRGGARIGIMNSSWPFATLEVDGAELELRCFGSYVFQRTDVVALDRVGVLPFMRGIRIRHNRLDMPARMIFWHIGRIDSVLEGIAETGFVPLGSPAERRNDPERILEWGIAAVIVVIAAAGIAETYFR